MNSSAFNAFSDGDSQQPAASGTYGKNLASSLSPMQARLTETHYGWSLELSPIRAFDALRVWSRLVSDVTSSDGEEPLAMLFDVELVAADRMSSRQRQLTETDATLGGIAEQLSIDVVNRFRHFDSDQLVMHEQAQRELIGMLDTNRVRSVLVSGPIEQRDAKAMIQAIQTGHSALEVEFRAAAYLQVQRDRVATLHVRDKNHAALLVAENFRHYLAALRSRPASEFAAPQASQLRRLLDVSGSLTVRPIETDVFSTSVDIGISTSTASRSVPADQSLIYDIPSDSWHDEP